MAFSQRSPFICELAPNSSLQFWFSYKKLPSGKSGDSHEGLLIAAVGMLAVSVVNPASAADVTPPRVTKERRLQPPLPVPVFNWTGFYIGGNVGYGWSHSNYTNDVTGTLNGIQRSATTSGSMSGQGGLGGGQIGFNYQFLGGWVAGIEADIDAAHLTSSTSVCFTGVRPTPAAVCGTRDTQLDDFGTLRGRLGYAFNNVLVYGTGGWAWSHGSNTINITCIGPECPGTSAVTPRAGTSVDVNPNGWAAGGGVEWGFLPNWTLRAEYLHLQFDGVTEDRGITGTQVPILITSRISSNTGVDVVRVGVNYLFNWWSPPLARY